MASEDLQPEEWAIREYNIAFLGSSKVRHISSCHPVIGNSVMLLDNWIYSMDNLKQD